MNIRFSTSRWITAIVLTLLAACIDGGGGSAPGPPGTIQLGATSYDGTEGTVVNIFITRSGGNSGIASVDYAITEGTAVAGSDYEAVNGALTGTITYADQSSGNRTIGISITDDNTAEGPESFTVTLSNASGAALGANTSATVDIIDNDVAPVAAFGKITALSSATVNGIRYDTNTTSVFVNGISSVVADLKLGQLVPVIGTVNFSNATGTADLISYSADIIGPIESLDATQKHLIVMGQTVLTNTDTVFASSINPDTYAGLTNGMTVQISGFRNTAGEVIATRVDPDTTSTAVQLIGTAVTPDLVNKLFSIGRTTIDYKNATLIDLPSGAPENGQLVIVRGSLINGILIVDEMSEIINLATTPGKRVNLSGIVTRYTSPTDFDLNGFPVTTSMDTDYINGVIGDLQADAEVIIDGEVAPGGGTVLASTVNFGDAVINRATQIFDFQNFTKISVTGFAHLTVTQGANFSVEVLADSDIIGTVQVTQTTDTVSFDLSNDARIRDAFVTMPVLSQIDVGAGSLANITLRNFSQPQMTVNVDGVSLLRGEALSVTNLTATVSGVSLLDFGDIQPIGNASINISGVSQAILNMDVGTTMTGTVTTGQGTGTSKLFYFGTSVTDNVIPMDLVSSVVRLGETKL